jgi:hypothetical protein
MALTHAIVAYSIPAAGLAAHIQGSRQQRAANQSPYAARRGEAEHQSAFKARASPNRPTSPYERARIPSEPPPSNVAPVTGMWNWGGANDHSSFAVECVLRRPVAIVGAAIGFFQLDALVWASVRYGSKLLIQVEFSSWMTLVLEWSVLQGLSSA